MTSTIEGLQREIQAQEAYIAQLKKDNFNGINNTIISMQEQYLANARTQLQSLINQQTNNTPTFTNPNTPIKMPTKGTNNKG